LSAGQLVELLPEWALPNADIHAIYLERHRLSAKLRTFIDFLVDELRSDTRLRGQKIRE
jgi:LysR family transcriptional activator of dmlA